MFVPVLHHVADIDVVVVFVDYAGREFEGRLVAVLEPSANSRVGRVDGAVVLLAETLIASVLTL